MFPVLQDREFYGWSERHVRTRISADIQSLQRMELQRKLNGHAGCVNTVSFDTETGSTLISGSDDLSIIFWHWDTGAKLLKYDSGHRHNVFQARMLPQTGGTKLVSCAADGQVRLSELPEGAGSLSASTFLLGQHTGRAHKLALDPLSPAHCFYSCGEDAMVMHFDLRDSAGARLQGAGSSSSRVGGCCRRKLLVCHGYSRSRGPTSRVVGINAVHVNPIRPWQFALGGGDSWARVYDVRRLRDTHDRHQQQQTAANGGSSRKTHKAAGLGDEPIARLCPEGLARQSGRSVMGEPSITGVMFSQQGELLVSYNDEDIYLFSVEAASGSSSSSNGSGSSREHTHEPAPTAAASPPSGRAHAGSNLSSGQQQQQQDQQQQQGPQGSPSHRSRAATAAAATSFAGVAGGSSTGASSSSNSSSRRPYQQGLTAAANRDTIQPSDISNVDSTDNGISKDEEESGRPRWRRRQLLLRPAAAQAGVRPAAAADGTRTEAAAAARASQQPNVFAWDRAPAGDGVSAAASTIAAGVAIGNLDVAPPPAAAQAAAVATTTATQPSSQQQKQPQPQQRLGNCDTGRDSIPADTDPVEYSNSKMPTSSHNSRIPCHTGFGVPAARFYDADSTSRDGVVASYYGHRNAATVKGVAFMGENDEYIMSGSDCGRIFIWSKQGGEIVWWQPGDEEVVNCLEPHPWLPHVLATSGIEHDIKIWAPTASRPQAPHPTTLETAMVANRRDREASREALSEPEQYLLQLLAAQRRRAMAVQRNRRRTAAAAAAATAAQTGGNTAAATTLENPGGQMGVRVAAAGQEADESNDAGGRRRMDTDDSNYEDHDSDDDDDDDDNLSRYFMSPGGIRIVWGGRRHRAAAARATAEEQGGDEVGRDSEADSSEEQDDGSDVDQHERRCYVS